MSLHLPSSASRLFLCAFLWACAGCTGKVEVQETGIGGDSRPDTEAQDTDSGDTQDDSGPDTGPDTGPVTRTPLPLLHAEAGHFRDETGAVVLLRGLSVAGNSKVPPYLPLDSPDQLDPLEDWGLNVIRLLFTWEAYEPEEGVYDEAYLQALEDVADAAWERGLYVIVDFHQDAFSRYLAGGCGDGFPEWAIHDGASLDTPDNGAACVLWAVNMTLDPDVHAAFGDFYADTNGVRSRFLALWQILAARFGDHPAVVGYDLINEPWGWEDSEISPLYEDLAPLIRAEDPDAILFLEGHLTTNTGANPSSLPQPGFDNFAYAPHFYDTVTLGAHLFTGLTAATDLGFYNMSNKAAEWDVPWLLGEFGMHADAVNVEAYMDLQYARLDENFASGTQWNYTPSWTEETKDGWNDEDLSVVDDQGQMRSVFRVRAYPRRIPGEPISFSADETAVALSWEHDPTKGEAVIFAPTAEIFESGSATLFLEGSGLTCEHEDDRLLRCSSETEGTVSVQLVASP